MSQADPVAPGVALPPIPRPTVRILLLDERDRSLLLRFWQPDHRREFWATPGGGIEPGEDHAAAARRELREELGVTGLGDIGPLLAVRHGVYQWRGAAYARADHFYAVRHRGVAPRAAPAAWRQDGIHEMRWWSMAEIAGARPWLIQPRALPRIIEIAILVLSPQPSSRPRTLRPVIIDE